MSTYGGYPNIRHVSTYVDLSTFKLWVCHGSPVRETFYCVGMPKWLIEKRVMRWMAWNQPGKSYRIIYPKNRPGHVHIWYWLGEDHERNIRAFFGLPDSVSDHDRVSVASLHSPSVPKPMTQPELSGLSSSDVTELRNAEGQGGYIRIGW